MNNKARLFSAILRNEGIHIRALSRHLDVGLPTIEHHLKKLEAQGLIRKIKEGRNIKIFPNYKNLAIIPEICSSEYLELSKIPQEVSAVVFSFIASLDTKPVITAIFGSYTDGTFTDKSDIDLFLIFNEPPVKEIEKKSKAIKYKYDIDISPVYMSYAEFSKKFFDEKDTFMKELKKKRILIEGISLWVMLENEK
ncbi:MAG: nucleotidyltransferase domain-containing protein [Candidatus Aenigmarchaeota archaeon]|nr:nucleotidyltransferase domain-containing protein [Candidatus Aenigmarchaeota archaeon]MCK5322359.1 nucleotidyltransferase domain-containing protein [Candidatus Aenigmarchaeota archaeon]